METGQLAQFATWAQIISLPVAVIAIFVSIWLYFRSKRKRAVGVEFNYLQRLKLSGDLKISYKGEVEVENLSIIQAKVRNVGNLAIRESHVVEPLQFSFGSGVTLLDYPELIDKEPEELNVDLVVGQDLDVVEMKLKLFNPGNELTLSFVVTGEKVRPRLTAMIEDVSEIKCYAPGKMKEGIWRRSVNIMLPVFMYYTLTFIALALVMMFFNLAFGFELRQEWGPFLIPLSWSAVVVAIVAFLLIILSEFVEWKWGR